MHPDLDLVFFLILLGALAITLVVWAVLLLLRYVL